MYYTKDTEVFLNGKFIKAADAHTDLFSQTLHYGFGVFEGIRSYQTQNGVKLFKAFEHFERLRKSCAQVGIPISYDSEELTQIAYQLIERNGLTDAYIRPLAFCGPNMYLSTPKDVSLMMCSWKWGKYHGDKLLKLCVSSYQRPNPAAIKVDAKISGQYVNGILATSEAKGRGYDEALLLDMNGNVAAAPAANFFMEKDGALYTPSLGHIFPSITRQVVLNICRELDIRVVEKQINPHELESADSAFLCGTAVEIAGVESIDANKFTKAWRDTLGAVIQEAYKCQVLEKSFSYVII
ncbi:MAG TPA: branched-chain amino acid transaminase [Chryseosolibacter sp.]|nr:branched-chain amino acid transaminase [Chryseosolibacter sp.]